MDGSMIALRALIASLERRIAAGGYGVTRLRERLYEVRHRLLRGELDG